MGAPGSQNLKGRASNVELLILYRHADSSLEHLVCKNNLCLKYQAIPGQLDLIGDISKTTSYLDRTLMEHI